MGRVFMEDVEEPDIKNVGRAFVFTKVFNTFLVPPLGCVITRDVFCVYCTAILGRHLPTILEYAAANYHMVRNVLHEPEEESSDDEV